MFLDAIEPLLIFVFVTMLNKTTKGKRKNI